MKKIIIFGLSLVVLVLIGLLLFSNNYNLDMSNGPGDSLYGFVLVSKTLPFIKNHVNYPEGYYNGFATGVLSPDGKNVAFAGRKIHGASYNGEEQTDIFLYNIKSKETLKITSSSDDFSKGCLDSDTYESGGNNIMWSNISNQFVFRVTHFVCMTDVENGDKTLVRQFRLMGYDLDSNSILEFQEIPNDYKSLFKMYN